MATTADDAQEAVDEAHEGIARDGGAPSVAVCICTRGRPDELAMTLASIVRSSRPAAQVIVSDDAPDRSAETACRDAELPVTYLRGPQRGLGANRNRALEAVRSDYVAFLDDDCLLRPEFLTRALLSMRQAEERHGAGRVIVSGRELNGGKLIAAADQTFLGFQARKYGRDELLRSIVINATVFPARLFDHVRFDPQLVYGYEEVDLASRAAAAGYFVVHCADAINNHRPSPRGREDHDRHVDASRLHVTLRRYVLTERAPLRAIAFALVAPLHVLAANLRRFGVAGIGRSVHTLALATKMLLRAGR